MSTTSRVSIPNNVKKIIQSIKEITGNHSEDDIYAMLKECFMDPNETTQKLLLQDTFHEVKRKRDKKKEVVPSVGINIPVNGFIRNQNKESADSRRGLGSQGPGGRGARGNHSSHRISHGVGDVKVASAGKETGIKQGAERIVTPASLSTSHEAENKAITSHSRSSAPIVKEPKKAASSHRSASVGSATNHTLDDSVADANNLGKVMEPSIPIESVPFQERGATVTQERGSQQTNSEVPSESQSTSSQNLGDRHQIEKYLPHDVVNSELPSSKAPAYIGNSFIHGKMPSEIQGVEKPQGFESSEPSYLSIHGGALPVWPSSNYGNSSQQLNGSHKAIGPVKEWKPKLTTPTASLVPGTVGTSEVLTMKTEAVVESPPTAVASPFENATPELQKKLEGLHVSHGKHVIIPNHLQVPKEERFSLTFGSFDATFGVSTSCTDSRDNVKSTEPLSSFSEGITEAAEDPSSSHQIGSPDSEEGGDYSHTQSPTNMQENSSSGEVENEAPECENIKPEIAMPPAAPRYSVHTTPTYCSFGLMPPMLGTQFAPFDSSEPESHDVSHLPGFLVQQPFDPSANYYTQLYRPSADGDGRISPFLPAGGPTKYNGNIAVLSSQAGQESQEAHSGNSQVLSTADPTPQVTQSAAVLRSSIAMTQHPVPVFRQSAGVHLPHYPTNYIPYNQFFSPLYVQPPSIHHFPGNPPFPQQPPTGNVYPSPAATAAAATGVKYSYPNLKSGNSTGNSAHVGIQTGYGPYSSSSASYGPSPATSAGNSTCNEARAASQYKENNVYFTGQQSEGAAVYLPAPSRDIPGLQTSSFYNLPPQGQHLAFPSQGGHGTFPGLYHPVLQQAQTMGGGVEIAGPPTSIYQQPQRPHTNWPHNY